MEQSNGNGDIFQRFSSIMLLISIVIYDIRKTDKWKDDNNTSGKVLLF